MNGTVKARELLKQLMENHRFDLPVVVVNDDERDRGYRPVQGITVLHNGCLVLHVGSRSEVDSKEMQRTFP